MRETRIGKIVVDGKVTNFEDGEGVIKEVRFTADEFAHLARANGYIKLEPGQVVVDVKHLEFARVWFRVFRKTRIDWTIEADHDADRAFAAAIDAAKENHDAR